MLEKVIKYTDYRGNEREETFFFNLSEAELTEMNFEASGNLACDLERIVKTSDVKAMGEVYRRFILKAYGEISPDGRRFMKDDGKLAKAFAETEAYSVLYRELLEKENAAVDFFRAVLPKK